MNLPQASPCIACAIIFLAVSAPAEDRNLNDVPSDLVVPTVTDGAPAAGKRVWQKLPDFASWDVAHAVYLPADWKAGAAYPVLCEYPGNGNYRNKLGDRSDGRVADCRMGYGLSGGNGFLWVSLPFVDPATKAHTITWWGDPALTAEYCRKAVAQVCRDFGGDSQRLVLIGFSRGAIAGNFIGLRDEETAKLWRAFILHSHYDGVREWKYAESDRASARQRLLRLRDRPQFVSHELSTADVRQYLAETGIEARVTFAEIPYPNHSPDWLLKELPERTRVRKWLEDVTRP